ncbi:Vi polysaccharide export protein VexE [Hartmannibacter diazotrophicus]|uniref:protein O-GlcNAc transferase n=1 Tax=Hartmannibacter diazotrophicus TaxID=1482074 RepID=A0A2C9D4U5_9HYPH|nr:tetratricopeptide repeat protein [Hartmannibacter diazotrophicus]SON55168.1 Vi polysaccharide export protein VexE [Hartmannibacter diazotrophicus]
MPQEFFSALPADPFDDALARHREGELEKAIESYRALLVLKPADPHVMQLLGVALFQRGDQAAGLLHLQRAYALSADDPTIAGNFAKALQSAGKTSDAIPILRRLLRTSADHQHLKERLATICRLAGYLDEAEKLYRELIKTEGSLPKHVEGLARVLAQDGRKMEAAELLSEHLVSQGRSHGPMVYLAGILGDLGHLADAAGLYEQAVKLKPEDIATRLLHIRTLMLAEDFDSAFATGLEALEVFPKEASLHITVGNVLVEAGHVPEALLHFREAVNLDRENAQALAATAACAMRLDQKEAAGRLAARAIELDASGARGYLVLASLARELGSPEEALRLYEEALSKGADSAQVRFELASILAEDPAKLSAALEHLLAGLNMDPQHYAAWCLARHVARMLARHDILAELDSRNDFRSYDRRVHPPLPSWLLDETDDPQEHLDHARRYWDRNAFRANEIFARSPKPMLPPPPEPDDKIVIGYVSGRFHEPDTAPRLAGLLELHDRRRFSIHAYCHSPQLENSVAKRLKSGVDLYQSIKGMGAVEFANTIARNGVHILVDLDGYREGSRIGYMGLRAAPIQVSWLGYPGSSGSDAIDYLIADRIATPDGATPYHSENLVRVPYCHYVHDTRRRIEPIRPRRSEFGLPDNAFVLACFGNPNKVGAETLATWSSILSQTPRSVLWLRNRTAEVSENIKTAFAHQGIDPNRIIISPYLDEAKHLARLPLADLCLDTFPHGSRTASCEALWMGVPVLTRSGNSFSSRVTASMLVNVGLPDLICPDDAAFEAKVVSLVKAAERLRPMRDHLLQRRQNLPLFDMLRFAAHLEAAFTAMVDRWRKDLPPEAIDIAPLSRG